jgi:hypothetical protein
MKPTLVAKMVAAPALAAHKLAAWAATAVKQGTAARQQQGTASKLATQQHSSKVPARKQARLSSKAAAEVKQEAANGLQWQLQKQQSKAAPAKQKQLGVQAAWCASYGGSLLVVDVTLTCCSNEAALDQMGPTRF